MEGDANQGKGSLYRRLLSAQEKIGVLSKGKQNPFYNSSYTDINAVIEMVKPVMNEEGLILLQPLSNIDGKPAITTTILTTEGESFESTIALPDLQDPQKMGSAITYYRRYALQSLLFIQAEDDDANATASISPHQAAKPAKPSHPPTQAPLHQAANAPQAPRCSICNEPMKATKPGSVHQFFCKHGDEWGKPIMPDQRKIPQED